MLSSRQVVNLFLSLIVSLFLTQIHALAQTVNGELVGTVIDATGASIPNASVAALNQGTNTRYTATTNNAGEYRIPNLPPGLYDVNVTSGGFSPATLKDVTITSSLTATANITLTVGQVASNVSVTAAAIAIDTTTAQVQSSYSTKLAADLPNVVSAGSTSAGVLNLSLLQSGVGTSGGVGLGYGPTVGGQRPTNNNFMVEGADNNGKYSPGYQLYIPNDSVAEFTLLQNQFQAEYGHSSGGQFNTIVKSGTNQFHVTVYDYLLNRKFDALDPIFARQGYTDRRATITTAWGSILAGQSRRTNCSFSPASNTTPLGRRQPQRSLCMHQLRRPTPLLRVFLQST